MKIAKEIAEKVAHEHFWDLWPSGLSAEAASEERARLLAIYEPIIAAKLEPVIKILNSIACWHDGQTVGGWFDEPASAQQARDALALLSEEE